VVVSLEQGADLRMAQLMALPLTVSCFSKIQIGFTFLVPAHLGSPGQTAVKRVCAVCVLMISLIAQLAKVTRCVKSFVCLCAVTLTSLGVRRSTRPLKSERTDEMLVWSSVWSSAIISTA